MVSQQISHYRIIRKLGAGGMGEVFLAEDINLGRKVAIKTLHSRSIGNEQARKRLFLEARAAATLDHSNICPIHEVGEDGDRAFIVMQYIEGTTLSKLIRDSPLSPLEIVDVGMQAAEALAEAHSHGIIHRDIKPQNIIVNERGHLRILDFGLAKIVRDQPAAAEMDSRLTDTGEVVGTVGYMSPEQLKDQPIDARTDLFSLGVTLYECATGKAAFSGSSKIQISLQVIQSDPPEPSLVNPQIPLELDDLILKAIAKDADERYQSANEMLGDLRSLRTRVTNTSASNTRVLTPEPGASRTLTGTRFSNSLRIAPQRVKIGFAVALLAIIGTVLAIRFLIPSPYQPSARAKTWYDSGLRDMRAGTFYQASKALETSVAIDDKFALAHARLAETYVELDSTDKAMEEFLRAISLAPDRSSLASMDVTYLDAVGATVRREFPTAIGYYQELSDKAPDAEKAAALVSLGRAYEKNEDVDNAQRCYQEASQKDTQFAAAFLRLAVVYGRRLNPQADTTFAEAEKLYSLGSNQEGVAEVLYQRGALLVKSKNLAQAQAKLEEALKMAQSLTDNNYQILKTQLQLSSVYSNEGDTARATKVATDAIELAQKLKIQSLATNGLIDLGYSFLSRGEFNEASRCFKQALESAQRDKARTAEARAKRALGSLNQQQGNTDAAIAFLQDALKFYQDSEYRREAAGALLLLGRAYRDKGDYDAAVQKFEQTLQVATELPNPALMASSHSSIAILRGELQERYADALAHLDESYKINEQLSAKKDMAYDQMNRGAYLWQLGRYDEAGHALDLAFSIASRPEANFKAVLAWVSLASSQMALSEGRTAEAKEKGQEALKLAGTDIRDITVLAKMSIGRAQAASGAAQQGRKLCEEALSLAKEVNVPQLISSALLALAEVSLSCNAAQPALDDASQAEAMFAKSGQQDSQWRALLFAARASRMSNAERAAQDYASRSLSLVNSLQQKWGPEAFETYMRRADIKAYRKQLDQLIPRSN